MLSLVEWYISALNAGRKWGIDGSSAKKPYNPVIGETFCCSWKVPSGTEQHIVRFTAEQVSHHPAGK